MQTKHKFNRSLFGFGLMIFLFAVSISAQTTAFTYQGNLTDAGNPASGNYLLQFKLFDAAAGGTQIGATVDNVFVTATAGVFNTRLDFGATPFTGADRFLEISVKKNAGDAFTVLSPRQQIASSPYSIRTLSAAQADVALDSQKLGGVDASQYVTTSSVGNSFIRNSTTQQAANFNISGSGIFGGSVGIRTNSPQSPLSVFAADYGFTQTDGNVTVGSFVNSTSFGTGAGWYGTRSNHPLSFFTNDSSAQMTVATNGNVGIGTGVSSPATRLALNGGPVWTSNGWAGSLSMGNASAIGWEPNASGQRFGIGQTTGGLYFFRTNSAFGTNGSPSNYDMQITDTGNITQPVAANGLVKAMIYVNPSLPADQYVVRCYNGITNSSTGSCGFSMTRTSTGQYLINFGFQVNNRFFSLTTFTSLLNGGANTVPSNANTVAVGIYDNFANEFADTAFYLIVY
ncbi:MAG: hypothetical protein M3Q99_14170 [Acidobacteriota bacterium]|nr:hypothetical protein [Acidobacteriota bacterium]